MASTVDREFTAGDSFNYVFSMRNKTTQLPVDLTGYTVKMQLKRTACSAVALSVDGTIESLPPTDPNDPTTGTTRITLPITPAESTLLGPSCDKGVAIYLYDIQLTDSLGSIVDTVLKGIIRVAQGVTV